MKTRLFLCVVLLGCAEGAPSPDDVEGCDGESTTAEIEAYDPLALVDPLVGTGGLGVEVASINPGAAWPNGMVTVGPDTRNKGSMLPPFHCAGYYYPDAYVHGFSHIHPHGMGVTEGSALTLSPQTGWSPGMTQHTGRLLPLDHALEHASPGRYAIRFEEADLDVDIVATPRGALWTVSSPEPVLVFDAAFAQQGDSVEDAYVTVSLDDGVVEVFQDFHGSYSERYGGLQAFMSARIEPAPTGGGTWTSADMPVEGQWTAEGAESGAWLTFPPGTETVTVQVGVSVVDVAGAAKNREAEHPTADRAARLVEVEDAWRELLGRVRVSGERPERRARFHTAQYFQHLMPSRMDDVDGRYRAHDQTIKTTDDPYYSDMSLWDTFRTTHPWYIVAAPELQRDVLTSLLRMHDDGGALPRWPHGHGYTGGMVGTPTSQMFAESRLKGLDGVDYDAAFAAVYSALTEPQPAAGRGHLASYLKRGWISADEAGGGSASDVLEYAWNDHAAWRWALQDGYPEADQLQEMQDNWRNMWDPKQMAFVARSEDGSFVELRNQNGWNSAYTEGGMYDYLWYVPYDVPSMVDVQHEGDVTAFHERLMAFWDEVEAEEDDYLPDSWYWHGNQPPWAHVAMGSLSGRPDISARAAHEILDTRYALDPEGQDGNDDGGSNNAWYLWNSLGFYPVAGTDLYALTSPRFARVEIDRGDTGQTWVLRAPGAEAGHIYPTAVRLNAEEHGYAELTHDELFGSADVCVELSDTVGNWEPVWPREQ